MFWTILTAAVGLLSGLVGYQVGGHSHPTAFVFTLIGVLVVLGVRDLVRNKHAIIAGTLVAGLLGWHFSGFEAALVAGILAFAVQISINDFIQSRHPVLPISLMLSFIAWWAGWHYLDAIQGLVGALLAFLSCVAVDDYFLQRKHTIRRNFPLIGWCRYGFELIGDELRQYWFMSDTEETPYNRITRRYIYRSAKGINNNVGFGTQRKYRDVGEIHMRHRMFPIPESNPLGNRLPPLIIGKKRKHPYHCPWPINISGMSFGALSAEAVQALSSGAKLANIHMLTGEGGLTPYHLEGVSLRPTLKSKIAFRLSLLKYYALKACFVTTAKPLVPGAKTIGGGRIMVQLGPAKFGFRKFFMTPLERGFRKVWSSDLDLEKLAEVAQSDQIVGFEIKLAQGAKPGQGGKLPKEKITPEISDWRGIPMGEDCYSPNAWEEFNDIPSLFKFVKMIQDVTGKPVGIKIVCGHEEEVRAIAKYMQETGEGPDMITIDGGEGGTGAAPGSLADTMGMPILHAIPLVDNIFREYGVRDEVVLVASGQISKGSDVAIAIAMGADMVNIGRGNMIAEGCIMALKCHTNHCPVGVATQDPRLRRGLDPADKYVKVANYNLVLQRELLMMCRSAGVSTPWQLTRHHLSVVTAPLKEESVAKIHPYPDGSDGRRNLALGAIPADDPEHVDRFGPKLIQIGVKGK